MTTKFGLEIEFKGLGSKVTLVAEQLRSQAIRQGWNFEVVGENYNHQVRSHWKVVKDRSVIGGCELVSPPLPSNQESFDLVKKVYNLLESCGARVDRQCGTHIHFDASFINTIRTLPGKDKFFTSFVECYRVVEPKFNTLVKNHRNNNRYCRTTLNDDDPSWVANDRYRKVNCREAFNRHGTLEFRHLQGTLNGDTVIAWINLCKTFTENVWKFFKEKNPQIFETPVVSDGGWSCSCRSCMARTDLDAQSRGREAQRQTQNRAQINEWLRGNGLF
jgi:hypothetical protein